MQWKNYRYETEGGSGCSAESPGAMERNNYGYETAGGSGCSAESSSAMERNNYEHKTADGSDCSAEFPGVLQWNNYRYETAGGHAVLTQYCGEDAEVVIPESLGGFPVTEIGPEAFAEYGEGVERITVPSSVKIIRSQAFKMCLSLTELVLSEGLEEIGEDAFFLTPLTELSLPSTVSRIGKLWELGDIRWNIHAGNPHFFTDGYGLYSRQADGTELSVVCRSDPREVYRIQDGTARIGPEAFAGQENLTEVCCPASLRGIGDGAFESCVNLARISLNEGLEEIGADAFGHCVSLTDIRLPSSLRVLGQNALTHAFGWNPAVPGLSRVRVQEGNPVFWADESALYEKQAGGAVRLVKYFGTENVYTVSAGVSVIGTEAFRRAGVKRLTLPDSLRTVEENAFRECKNMQEIVLRGEFAEAESSAGVRGSDQIWMKPRACGEAENAAGARGPDQIWRKQPACGETESSAKARGPDQMWMEQQARGETEGSVEARCPNQIWRKPQACGETEGSSGAHSPGMSEIPQRLSGGTGSPAEVRLYIPRNPVYRKEEVMELFRGDSFDFSGYDRLFDTYLDLAEQAGIACCRLLYPVRLPAKTREIYLRFLSSRLPEILTDICAREDIERLENLTRLGMFDRENIDACIDILNRERSPKLLGFLMNYRQEHFADSGFDFLL